MPQCVGSLVVCFVRVLHTRISGQGERGYASSVKQRGIMSDREFLIWLHGRLVSQYGVPEGVDYLHRLRSIIRATPADQTNRGTSVSGIVELRLLMKGDES